MGPHRQLAPLCFHSRPGVPPEREGPFALHMYAHKCTHMHRHRKTRPQAGSHLFRQPGGPQAAPPSGKTVAQGTEEPFVRVRENSVCGGRGGLTHYLKENTLPGRPLPTPPPGASPTA